MQLLYLIGTGKVSILYLTRKNSYKFIPISLGLASSRRTCFNDENHGLEGHKLRGLVPLHTRKDPSIVLLALIVLIF
jgi:hypothetical protein